MPDIALRFHKDMLVLSSPVAVVLARQGFDVEHDLEFANLVEPEAVRDALRLNKMAGAQCLVANTEGIAPARLAHRGMEDRAAEIVRNYDVDGIHLDDYFYPTTETAFDAAAFADAKADDLGAFRLEQVNAMVQQIYSTVKAASPAIQLSISRRERWTATTRNNMPMCAAGGRKPATAMY